MTRTRWILTLAGVLALAAPAGAQGRGRGADSIPTAYRPPAGMCRIWLDNVPPAQQPAPTDCASAVRNRPSNGRVIFGDEPKDKKAKFKPRQLRGGDDAWERRPDDDRRRDDDDAWSRRDDDDEERVADGRAPRARTDEAEDARYRRIFRGGSDVCIDRNRDGRCDDAQQGGDACIDADRDGNCDNATGALPAMAGGALFVRGVRTPEVINWIGDLDVTARVVDANRDGTPERVTWLDPNNGQVVQTWFDRDGDGRADRVEFWRNGQRTRVLGRP